MAINYTWSFNTMQAVALSDGLTNVITSVFWGLIGDDGVGNAASRSGFFDVPFNPGNPFIPYEDLTAVILENWAHDAMDVPALKADIALQVAFARHQREKLTPVSPVIVTLPPPWDDAVEVTQ